MIFRYETLMEPLDLKADSLEARNYKAGAGALIYALKHAGWTEEQIANGMRSHFESTAAVLAEHIRGLNEEAAAKIDPKSNPCGRSYCTTCCPAANRN